MNNQPNENLKKKLLKANSDFLRFSTMGFKMLAIIGVLTYGGFFLDKKYPNQYHLFTIVLSLIGVFAAMYSIIKDVTSNNP
ncbi:MAG: AtpZ/AtpI family protein [Bacteroidia bacterium]|nr:AtpZ/AtpI family protein [Bacteroidia bacterium]